MPNILLPRPGEGCIQLYSSLSTI